MTTEGIGLAASIGDLLELAKNVIDYIYQGRTVLDYSRSVTQKIDV
jgi:hypothetical protein